MRFKNKVAIVTGGASGIGKATAALFASEGAKVVIVDIDPDAGNKAAREIKRKKGSVLFVETDITNEEDVQRAIHATMMKYGEVNVLVNNAVKFMFKGLDATAAELRESLETNVIGHHLMTQHAVAEMKKSGSGSIILVGSISSVIAQPNALTYNTPKGAILQMTRCAALELAPHKIRVNCVCPGHVSTPAIPRVAAEAGMTVEAFDEERRKTVPLGYIASPKQIAGPIAFLASDEASYMTGAILMVDGGYTIQ